MKYALIKDNIVIQYPYGFAQLRNDNQQVSFPRNPSDEKLAEFGVVIVASSPTPVHNPITENVVEVTPVQNDGIWTQAFSVETATAEEIASRQKSADDETSSSEIKADIFVENFIKMTPAQLSEYIDDNATTVAALRVLVKKMALMLLILARRGLR
jgi:hypothetical protein